MSISDSDRPLLDEARKIVPVIREARDFVEQQRRLPASVLAALHEARLFRMMIPRDVEGLQVDPLTSTKVVEAIAAADGATGRWTFDIRERAGLSCRRTAAPSRRSPEQQLRRISRRRGHR